MIVVLWGVSGCGKTTVGALLARKLGCKFYDADDFHPPENVEKMRAGKALADADRWPWLRKIAKQLEEVVLADSHAVLACSALKQSYRDVLNVDFEYVRFVQLNGSFVAIAQRLAQREHEFMPTSLLQSQFDTLEISPTGLVADIESSPEEICQIVITELALA